MTVASFQTGSYLTILIPVCLLILVLIWWAFAMRRRGEL
jgi:hypothetical protein